MAYPTVSAPYGLQPVNRLDGLPYAGATQLIPIASTYNTAIYNGDLVYITGGTIAKSGVTVNATTAANLTAGVFMGCQYVNTLGQTVQAQYYPGNVAATSAKAYVVIDPQAAFKVAVTFSGNTTVTSVTQAAVGVNLAIRQGAGNANTGDSGVSVVLPTAGAGNASTLPVKVVSVVPETAVNATNFTEVLVVLTNPQLSVAAGNDYA